MDTKMRMLITAVKLERNPKTYQRVTANKIQIAISKNKEGSYEPYLVAYVNIHACVFIKQNSIFAHASVKQTKRKKSQFSVRRLYVITQNKGIRYVDDARRPDMKQNLIEASGMGTKNY